MTILGEHRDVAAAASVHDGGPGPDVQTRPTGRTGGAWHPRCGVGDRRFARLGALELESGAVLEDATLAYESWGS
ncbi:MAG: homoserine O-acetyltransferase, partial [Brachybacterium sp.]|nr:homoserine O-acetyltransferase [Brachybacterium sp.]